MIYNWQLDDWPNFRFDESENLENMLLEIHELANRLEGFFSGMNNDKRQQTLSIITTDEAMATSAIEGEHMSRHDVMSSIMHQLDRALPDHSKDIRAKGIGQLMMSVREDYYCKYDEPHFIFLLKGEKISNSSMSSF